MIAAELFEANDVVDNLISITSKVECSFSIFSMNELTSSDNLSGEIVPGC